MARLLLIGCGASKLELAPGESPPRAEDLYTGSLFRSRALWANETGLDWWVLSAKFGLLSIDAQTAPYDLSLEQLSPVDRAAWSVGVASSILDQLADDDALEDLVVEIHAGKVYADQLEAVLVALGVKVDRPLQGIGMLGQRGWYRRQREQLEGSAS